MLTFLSQNEIETALVTLVWHLLSPGLRGVLVPDRGFARAALFAWLEARHRDLVIPIDAKTHVQLSADQPSQPVARALALRPGDRAWQPRATYHKEERVLVNLHGVWDPDHQEPWYLVAGLEWADWTETCHRWRMRIECANRDEKTGVLLREGGDAHALRNLRHVHRLLPVLCAADWLTALVGLQACRDLPAPEDTADRRDAVGATVLAAPAAPSPRPAPSSAAVEGSEVVVPAPTPEAAENPILPPPDLPTVRQRQSWAAGYGALARGTIALSTSPLVAKR